MKALKRLSKQYLDEAIKEFNYSNAFERRICRRIMHYRNRKFAPNLPFTICGLHSGIPLCCQMWFGSGWSRLRDLYFIDDPYNDTRIWMYRRNIQYIPCPDCVERIISGRMKPIKIKECNCHLK